MKYNYSKHTIKTAVAGLFFLFILPVFGTAPYISPDKIETAPPRIIRTCCSFGADLHMGFLPFIKYTDITSLAEIGEHEYLGGKHEGNGNIYTQRGGFIDLGHLRDCADWTAYLYNLILTARENSNPEIIDIGFEGGSKKLTLDFSCEPDSFDAAQLAGKIAYDLSLWHEIATWYGASLVPLVPERYSAFSPEDLYSNLLGVHLAMQALQSDEDYNTAMTRLLAETLDSLGVVKTREETYTAMEKVENLWWNGKKPLPSKKILLKRFLDAENELIPWLVPGEDDNALPSPLAKPADELNDFYKLEIKLNYHFPLKKIFGNKKSDIVTQLDFETILRQIATGINRLDEKVTLRTERKNQRRENRLNS